jgi:hypothetical protein
MAQVDDDDDIDDDSSDVEPGESLIALSIGLQFQLPTLCVESLG